MKVRDDFPLETRNPGLKTHAHDSTRMSYKADGGGEIQISPALVSRNPPAWLTFFGPGAVMASLTIGAGELIFSSRGGAIFGYRLLWFFLLVLAFKWVLVFASARHIVLTGTRPFQRWMELPGPRGWFPLVLFIFAVICFPVWVCFHAGTLKPARGVSARRGNGLHDSVPHACISANNSRNEEFQTQTPS